MSEVNCIRSIILAIALLFLTACDAQTVVQGRVVNTNENPVAMAKVWLLYGSWTSSTETDKDGNFSVDLIGSPRDRMAMLISAGGYKLYYQEIDAKNRQLRSVKIKIEKGSQRDVIAKDAVE